MGIFFKAVRPDGMDFHSGTVDYASLCGTGETLPVLPAVPVDNILDGPQCCTGDVYHASVAKSDTLIGGTWPCRLFEVEGEPVAEEGTKRGFYTLKVLRELEAHEALGPNGVALVDLFTQVESLTWEQASRAPAQWEPYVKSTILVHGNTIYQAQDSDRDAALRAAEHHVRGLVLTSHTANHVVAIRGRARFAARMAARALVVKDLMDSGDFALLTVAWNKVMGREG